MSDGIRRAEPLLPIAVGGFAGATCWFLLDGALPAESPWGTLAVNVIGSFFLGLLTAGPFGTTPTLVLGVGFCGAFTTFSTFAFETVRLAEEGEVRRVVANGAANLAEALLAVGLGAGAALL